MSTSSPSESAVADAAVQNVPVPSMPLVEPEIEVEPPLDFEEAFRSSAFASLCGARNKVVDAKILSVTEKGTVTMDIGAKLPVILKGNRAGIKLTVGAQVPVKIEQLETVTHLVGCPPLAHLTGSAKATIVRKL